MSTKLGRPRLPESEANLQAEFYHVAKTRGLNVTLELSTKCGRVDIAVLTSDNENLLAVVEVKKSRKARESTGQFIKYQRLGVPVLMLKPGVSIESMILDLCAKQEILRRMPLNVVCSPRKRAAIEIDESLNIKP